MNAFSRWPIVPLGTVVEDTQYGTSTKANGDRSGIPILRMGNISYDGSFDLTDMKHVGLSGHETDRYCVRRGDLLFNRTNSPELVGKMGVWTRDEAYAFAGYLIRIRVQPPLADPRFVAAWFNTARMKELLRARAKPSNNMSNINAVELLKFPLVLPPLQTQHRIIELLERAEASRTKRRAALALLDTLAQSIFGDIFGDPATNSKGWREGTPLGEVADIVSGVTKGRDLVGKVTREVPYLSVANVQDRALDLSAIKVIPATEDELARYRLKRGDLLLTEGGDPDKLGRGTLWNEEISECIHQNHIFRVRVTSSEIDPSFLNWLVGSQRGKRYFLRSAKQTTGIASINMTQLRGFPLLVPPVAIQQEFVRRIATIEKLKATNRASLAQLDALFASLQHRTFSGEL